MVQPAKSKSSFRPELASAAIFVTTMVAGGVLLLQPSVQDGPLLAWTHFILFLTRWILGVLGFTVERVGEFYLVTPDGFQMGVGNECNGAWAHLIFLASVAAYPAPWRLKLLGVAAGEAILFALNLFRVISLFIIGVYAPGVFRVMHVYVWQWLIIALALALFLVWVDRVVNRPA